MTAIPCPSCGKPTEEGFLVAESYVGGARWAPRRTKLGGGELLVKPDRLGNVYLKGARCVACRTLVLQY